MKKILFIFLTLFAGKTYSQGDVNINPNTTFNGESNLIVNPVNGTLTAEWMKLTTNPITISMATSYSTDNGLTWSAPVLLPHHTSNWQSADPTMTYYHDGTLYLAYIDYRLNPDSGGVYIVHSGNSGASWSNPVKAVDGFASADLPIDRPWIAVDNSGTASDGMIYLETKSYKDAPLPHKVWLTRSGDGGMTWSISVRVDTPVQTGLIHNSMGTLAVGKDGKVYLAYASYDLSQSIYPRYMLAMSTDQGQTFSITPIVNLTTGSALPLADSFYQAGYCLSANPIDPDNLIFIFTDNRNGDPDIYETYCVSNYNWYPEIRLNNDSIGNGKGQDMCWGGFSPGGIYGAAWRDRRSGASGQSGDFRIFSVSSPDEGVYWTTNYALSAVASPLVAITEGNDFIGVVVSDTNVRCSWSDHRNGTTDQLYTNAHVYSITSTDFLSADSRKFHFFPNPSHDLVEIKPEQTGKKMRIILTDINGKELMRTGFFTSVYNLDIRNLPPGSYLITVYNDTGKKTADMKIIKQ